MFLTNRQAERASKILEGTNRQLWSFVQHYREPWIHVSTNSDDLDPDAYMMSVASFVFVCSAKPSPRDFMHNVEIVTPPQLNQDGRWKMEPLIEITELFGYEGQASWYRCKTIFGNTYDIGAGHDLIRSVRTVFSAGVLST